MLDHQELNLKTTLETHQIMVLTGASECEIIENMTLGITYRVAYITSHNDYHPLNQVQLSENKLDGVIKINHMPLQLSGERDIEALKGIIPPIDLFKDIIEDKVAENTAIEEACVIAVPADKRPAILHLTSLLNSRIPQKIERNKVSNNTNPIPNVKQPTSVVKKVDSLVISPPLKDQTLNKTLPGLLINAAAKKSHVKITYLNDSSTETIDLNMLLDKARCIRNNLTASGINAGDYALIHADHPQEIIPIFWACILGGIIPTITPIPPMYHTDAAELAKLTGVWQLLDKPIIISTSSIKKSLEQSKIIGNIVQNDQCLTIEDLLISNSDISHFDHIPDKNDVAFICLSSGSTGTPKCIQMTHTNALVRSRGANHICQNSSNDIIFNWLPFDHIGSISDWHIRCIDLGCQMVYCNKDAILANPLEWINIINQYRVSHTWAPNFAYSAVNVALKQQSQEKYWDLSCIKIFLTAAETVSAETIHEFTSHLLQYGLNKNTIKPAFGMAEMGSGVTYNHPEKSVNIFTVSRDSIGQALQEAPTNSPNSVSFTCLGDIIPSMAMRIVNKKGGLVKEGVIGHLHMKGDCVSPGYYKNDNANAVFLDDGWMDTGDEGFILDQKLYLSGRTKDTIIIGGANYLPIEIEKTVEAIEGIAVSYVAATAVKPASEKSESLAIFFSLSDSDSDLRFIVRQIKESVSQKMGIPPNYLVCLAKHSIPKTAIGKIQRSKLAKDLEQGEFDSIISKIDLALENNRTLPDWFAEKYWMQYKRPNEYQPSIESFILLSYGQQSLDTAKQLQRLSEHNSVECTIFYYSKEPLKNELDKGITTLDITDSHSTKEKLTSLNPKKLSCCNIVNFLFLEDLNNESSTQLLLIVQQIKHIIESLEDHRAHAVSLVTLGAQNQLSIDTDTIFYQSLPALFRSVFSGSNILNTCIDFKKETLLAQNLYEELLCPQDNQEIHLNQNNRYINRIRSYQKLTQKNYVAGIKHQGLYVITGGLGGIGKEISTWLLSKINARLIIVGKSTQNAINKNKLKKQIFNSLQALGDIFYISSDLSDANALNNSIKEIETNAGVGVSGFFHLAGIVKETPFADETLPSMSSVLQAKAYSALSIHQMILKRPEAIVVYFSSTLSSIPSSTAPVYALANRMLDNLAELERKQGIKSYSIAWSAWKNTGMNVNINADAMLAAQGLYSLIPEQALNSLALSLCREPSNIMIGVNRFASALSKLSYNHVQCDDILHLAYVSSQPTQIIKHSLSTNKTIPTITSTQVDEIIKHEDGSINTEKMASIINGEEEFVEANTEFEKVLREIWCQVLKVDRVSMNGNFFSLGGHSLLAAELVNKINNTLNTTFSVGLVFEATTIAAQAKLIDTTEKKDQAQIIPLQEKGDYRPLFCLCGIEIYQALADKLSPDIPVYGIFLPIEGKLFDTKNTEHINVEAMAKEYAIAIMQAQSKGPYRLAGISFGGILAYETAKQLKTAGGDIELLCMIDFVLPNQSLRKIIQSKTLTPTFVIELLDTISASIKGYIHTLIALINEDTHPKNNQALVQNEYKRAWHKYRNKMQPWDDSESVMIFRSEDEPHRQGYSREVSCGWEHFMNKTPESYAIPGDHLGVLKEPNVGTMAALLKTRLLK